MGIYRGPNLVRTGLVMALDAGSERSYPGSGTLWKDLSGSGNDMTLYNTTFSDGSIVFNGTTSYADLGANHTLSPTSATISVWAKVVDFTTLSGTHTQQARVFVTSQDKNSDSLIAFWNGGYGWESQTNSVPYEINTTNTAPISAPDIKPQTWFNFTLVLDTNVSYAYVNGEFITSIANSVNVDFRYLGVGSVLNNYPDYLKGSVKSLMVYNTPHSAQDVSQNFNALKNRFI
jgi:hypothetical protein